MDIISYILSRKYCDNSIIGLGAIRGANCTISDIVHQDGINTVTFKWTGTDGTEKTRDMVVYDGTPIYVWESGNTYHYGDLAIYESQFYRCIVENNDATFDSTKWNEIGSPDGNYDIVQSVNLLPARFTAADRKLYYVIDENCFYLWNGTAWVKTISNKIADLDDVNLDDLTEGDVLVWDSVNEKWVNKAKFDEYKTTFIGTQAQWDALTPTQQNVYDIINITDDGEVINLGVYLEKKATLPTANADNLGKIYIYTGASNANYKKGACYECQQVGQNYTWVQVSVSKDDFNALGTASTKNYTSNVRPNNTDLVESQAVYSAINNALSSIYVPRGELSCAELTADLLIPANVGNVYTMSDSGTTSALFINGAGHPIAVNDNVGIIRAGADSIMFNLMGNAFDLHDYQTKELETPLDIDGTQATEVESALGGLNGAVDKRVTYEYNGKVGAKNLLVYPPYANGSGQYSNMQITINEDGSITINGTNDSGSTGYYFFKNKVSSSTQAWVSWLKSKGTSFRLSGGSESILLYIDFYNGDTYLGAKYSNSNNTSVVFDIPTDTDSVNMFVKLDKGVTADNLTIYPMIRLASDSDDTWQPYAKTNYELTQDVNSLSYIKDVPIAKGSGTNSIIEGDLAHNTASATNSHAEGYNTTCLGAYGHSEGYYTQANGSQAHAEGHSTTASGDNSHAEGRGTMAQQDAAHAEGNSTRANGYYSHAQNLRTIAQGRAQTVIGCCNIAQGTPNSAQDTDYAFIIGNGADADHRSNALAVQWDGTVVFQDNSTIKSAKTVYEVMGKMGAKNLISTPYVDANVTTRGGITYTLNADGSLTFSGTATSYSYYIFNIDVSNKIGVGKYTLSAHQSSDFPLDVGLVMHNNTDNSQVIQIWHGTEEQKGEITQDMLSKAIDIRITIGNGTVIANPITIYPMLRLADDQDSTWQPYAMTNKELTDKLNDRVEFTSQELQAMW